MKRTAIFLLFLAAAVTLFDFRPALDFLWPYLRVCAAVYLAVGALFAARWFVRLFESRHLFTVEPLDERHVHRSLRSLPGGRA